MTIEREVTVEGQTYPVILSDENEALQAAKAAGRAIVGLWRENGEEEAADPTDYSACLYLITDPKEADEAFLERVVRRHLDLPWIITETDRLIIREFSPDDPLELPSADDADGTFSDWNKREEYRKHQYRFAECGLWALERRIDGVVVGKAGLTDGELGYHIYEPFRRQGYALEACRAIVEYGFETLELEEIRLCTKHSNTASRALAERLGFIPLSSISSSPHLDSFAQKVLDGEQPFSSVQLPSPRKNSIVFCMQRGYNGLYTK